MRGYSFWIYVSLVSQAKTKLGWRFDHLGWFAIWSFKQAPVAEVSVSSSILPGFSNWRGHDFFGRECRYRSGKPRRLQIQFCQSLLSQLEYVQWNLIPRHARHFARDNQTADWLVFRNIRHQVRQRRRLECRPGPARSCHIQSSQSHFRRSHEQVRTLNWSTWLHPLMRVLNIGKFSRWSATTWRRAPFVAIWPGWGNISGPRAAWRLQENPSPFRINSELSFWPKSNYMAVFQVGRYESEMFVCKKFIKFVFF